MSFGWLGEQANRLEKNTKHTFSDIGHDVKKIVSPQDWKSDEWRTAGAVALGAYGLNKYGVPGTGSKGSSFESNGITYSIPAKDNYGKEFLDNYIGDSSNTAVNSSTVVKPTATLEELYGAKLANLNKPTPFYASPAAGALVTSGLALYGGNVASKAQAKENAKQRQYEKELAAQKAQNQAVFDLANKGYMQDIANNQNTFLYGNTYNTVNPYTNSKVDFDKDGNMSISNTGNNKETGLASVGATTGKDLDYYDMGYLGRKAKSEKDLAITLQNLKNIPAIISANAAATNASTSSRKQDQSENFVNNSYANYGV